MPRLYKGHLTGRMVTECGRVHTVVDMVLVKGADRLEVERFLERSGNHLPTVTLVNELRRLHPGILITTRVEYPTDEAPQVDDLYGYEPELS